jgi:hypothetical protein
LVFLPTFPSAYVIFFCTIAKKLALLGVCGQVLRWIVRDVQDFVSQIAGRG